MIAPCNLAEIPANVMYKDKLDFFLEKFSSENNNKNFTTGEI